MLQRFALGAHALVFVIAEVVEQIPGITPGVVGVVEDNAHGVTPNGLARTTPTLALPLGGGTSPPWPLFSTDGLSVCSNLNGMSNLAPASKTIRSSLAGNLHPSAG